MIDKTDPRVELNLDNDLDEVYNYVRVQYTNAKGWPRELVVVASELDPPLNNAPSGIHRTDVIQAPESLKSTVEARRLGKRYLRNHGTTIKGSVTITGSNGVQDPLLIRPGDTVTLADGSVVDEEVQHVTLNPLDWSASVQFGANSKRFDTWLARLAAGSARIRRR